SVGRARASADAQLEAAKTHPAAHLRAVFSSPEAQQWPRKGLGELAARISKGESPAWQGYEYTLDGPRFIRSENVLWGSFSDEPRIFIPQGFHSKLTRSKLKAGDVLINLVGASIGRACVLP